MSYTEEYLAKNDLGDRCLPSAVDQPLLRDLAGHLSISKERKENLVHPLHQLGVLLLRDGTPI